MASKSREKETQATTGDYSATKAPENRPHVESKVHSIDDSLKPGGTHGAPVDVGMSELHRDDVPGLDPDNDQGLDTDSGKGKVSPRTPDQAEGERGDGA